ncbi:Jasmonate O-methyltransferase [Bertholletia excelsa]
MEVMQVCHMNKGNGESSYAKNSILQRKLIDISNSIMGEALVAMLSNNFPNSMGIADLGCSSGPNTLKVISEIIDIVGDTSRRMGRQTPELRVLLNDLPGNDFNHIFMSLPEFYGRLKRKEGGGGSARHCFMAVVPGSFYGRLFPSKSLHIVHSSSSLHWLSQVPPALSSKAGGVLNKGRIYISKTSPSCVAEAYSLQYQKDFCLFLRSRSEEMVAGGRMVLSFAGRRTLDPTVLESCGHWELLAQAFMSMASQGHMEEEKIDSFNAPFYAPSLEEVKAAVETEGSFAIDRLEAFEVDWDGGVAAMNAVDSESSGRRVAKTIRAVVEPMLESHFGGHVMDDLFRIYGEIVDAYMSKTKLKFIDVLVSLSRK